MRRLRDQGLTYKEIGARFGVSGERASQIIGQSRRAAVFTPSDLQTLDDAASALFDRSTKTGDYRLHSAVSELRERLAEVVLGPRPEAMPREGQPRSAPPKYLCGNCGYNMSDAEYWGGGDICPSCSNAHSIS